MEEIADMGTSLQNNPTLEQLRANGIVRQDAVVQEVSILNTFDLLDVGTSLTAGQTSYIGTYPREFL